MANIRERGGYGSGAGSSGRRRAIGRSGEDVHPMNYISNLADAMLVLALGIMTALVLHWNVDLNAHQSESTDSETPAVSFDEEDIEGRERLPQNAQHTGEVYYDQETNTYYIVSENGTIPINEYAGE